MRNHAFAFLLVLLLSGCGSRGQRETVVEETPAAASIKSLTTSVVVVGKPFFVNKQGLSTLGVGGANIKPNSRVRMGSQVLATDVRKDGAYAAALVPAALLGTPGNYDVVVVQPDGSLSNVLVFTVLATTGPAPLIAGMYPSSTVAGQGFNIQASGGSALGMSGSNFRPDAKILFGTKELETIFGGVTGLSAWVPPALFATPGAIPVRVRNSDGKLSEPRTFTVKARP
jgi:hypothetical protein